MCDVLGSAAMCVAPQHQRITNCSNHKEQKPLNGVTQMRSDISGGRVDRNRPINPGGAVHQLDVNRRESECHLLVDPGHIGSSKRTKYTR